MDEGSCCLSGPGLPSPSTPLFNPLSQLKFRSYPTSARTQKRCPISPSCHRISPFCALTSLYHSFYSGPLDPSALMVSGNTVLFRQVCCSGRNTSGVGKNKGISTWWLVKSRLSGKQQGDRCRSQLPHFWVTHSIPHKLCLTQLV